jgi:hypothetical protein
LRRKHRAHQWARACDCREVVAEEHVLIGRNVIETVVTAISRRRPRTIDTERSVSDK